METNLIEVLGMLDARTARDSRMVQYYEGTQPLTFVSPESRKVLGDRLTTVSVNIPRLVVETIAERLRIIGFSDPSLWGPWKANDLDTLAPVVHREALLLGDAFVIVWANAAGDPLVTVESATQVAAVRDPSTREVTIAAKRWEDKTGTHAVLYGPDEIVRFHSPSTGATAGYKVVERIENPLGVVPVVPFQNGDRLMTTGVSEIADVLPLTDALVKLTTDMLTASEATARPRRWATGIELMQDKDGKVINPIPEDKKMMISEKPEAKFGQLAGSDLLGFENAISVVMRQISAVTGLPDHMLGLSGSNPTSADSIRASEATLTAKAEARQATFGRSWRKVAQLMTAVSSGVDPTGVDVSVKWADPSTRSVAQEADAVVKLLGEGVLSRRFARARLGYSDEEIDEMEADDQAEARSRSSADVLARAELAQRLEVERGMSQPAALAAAGLFAAANETRLDGGSHE